MNRIISFSFKRMTNALASQTYERVWAVLMTLTIMPLKTAIALFREIITAFIDGMRQPVASVVSRRLRELDPERDRMTTELFRNIHNALQSHDQETREAADFVDVVLRLYGNPSHLTFDEQTRTLTKLMRDLTTDEMFKHLNKLPIARILVLELKALNNQFSKDFEKRIREREAIIIGLTENNRNASDDAMREIVNLLNAYTLIEPESEELANAINSINTIFDEARITLRNRHRARRAGEQHEGDLPDGEDIEHEDEINEAES